MAELPGASHRTMQTLWSRTIPSGLLATLLAPKCTIFASCAFLCMLALYLAETPILMKQAQKWGWYHRWDGAGRRSSSLSRPPVLRRRTAGIVNDLLRELVARGKLFPKEEAMCQTSVSRDTFST